VLKVKLTKLFVNFLFKFGSATGLCPARWKNNGKRLRVVNEIDTLQINLGWLELGWKSYKRWLVYYSGIILTRFGYLAFIIYRVNTLEVSLTEQILTFLNVVFILMGVANHIWILFNIHGLIGCVNQLVTFNQIAGKVKILVQTEEFIYFTKLIIF